MEPNPESTAPNSWWVVCVKHRKVPLPSPHMHVAGVGTGERATWADMRWTVPQVLQAMKGGERFYVKDETNGKIVQVVKTACPVCHQAILGLEDGGRLEDLRECVYRSDPEFSFSDS